MVASVAGDLRTQSRVNARITVKLAVPRTLVGDLHRPEWESSEGGQVDVKDAVPQRGPVGLTAQPAGQQPGSLSWRTRASPRCQCGSTARSSGHRSIRRSLQSLLGSY